MDRLADRETEAYWDDHHHGASEDAGFWMAHPLCRAAINRRVGGDPAVWPLDWFRRRYAARPFHSAISLGCGAGNLERAAIKLALCDAITGFDVSARSLESAREKAREEGYAGIRYVRADLNRMRLPRRRFDAAFFHQSLHHVRSVEKLAARVARSLTADGILFLDEWTGPSRSEWDDREMAPARRLYAEMPREWRRTRELHKPVEGIDLSETVRSSAILPAIRLLFDVIEERPYGGHLVSLLLPQLDREHVPAGELDRLVERWLTLEDADLEAHPPRSYHTVVVARPRRGAAALSAELSALARRARLAARYRIPTAWRILTGKHTSSAELPPENRSW